MAHQKKIYVRERQLPGFEGMNCSEVCHHLNKLGPMATRWHVHS